MYCAPSIQLYVLYSLSLGICLCMTVFRGVYFLRLIVDDKNHNENVHAYAFDMLWTFCNYYVKLLLSVKKNIKMTP